MPGSRRSAAASADIIGFQSYKVFQESEMSMARRLEFDDVHSDAESVTTGVPHRRAQYIKPQKSTSIPFCDNTRKLMEWFFTNVSFVQTSMLGAHKPSPPPPPRHRVSSRNHTIDQQFFSLAVLLPSPRSSSLLRFGIGHDGHPLSVLDLAMELYHCEKGEK
uniref:Uncharacterized protein n=2 Tax=Oryza rufipogon TaxID=4529 RepID=A0A0E0NG90_ORYRU